ncbi:MAG: hypothetical protein ABSE49_28625, partial [Polyangiaceae bacterium]
MADITPGKLFSEMLRSAFKLVEQTKPSDEEMPYVALMGAPLGALDSIGENKLADTARQFAALYVRFVDAR